MSLLPCPSETVAPNPADLLESMRDFGYTLSSALADLVDNSLTAGARHVSIIVEPSVPSTHIAIVDDGCGMSEDRLVEAMRIGTLGPLAVRAQTDLGRFGLGMKTASLSQGRCVTVVSKHGRNTNVRRWDLSHVKRANEWQLLKSPTESAKIYEDRLSTTRHGTAVIIENLDRMAFLSEPDVTRTAHLSSALNAIREHLGMVYHRFIEEDNLEIRIGEGLVSAWDPYLSALSSRLPQEPLKLPGVKGQILVTPFVLPHHSHLSDDQHERAGGPLGWNAHQGFYIYRCRRLIVPGTWLNLRLKKEEHYKLARIRVDLPNTMDDRWQLNVMKSHVSAPPALLDDFRRIASDVRRQASEVYRIRGERQAPSKAPSEHFIWRRELSRTGVRFRVDRSHPVVRAVLHSGCQHEDLLEKVVSLIESTVPIAAMLQEPQKAIDGMVASESPVDLESLVDTLLFIEQHWIRTGMGREAARGLVLSCEPFAGFRRQVLDRLQERTNPSQPEAKNES